MKIIKGLALLSAIATPISKAISVPAPAYQDAFDYIEVPPLNAPDAGSTRIRFKVSYATSNIKTATVYIYNSVYPDGVEIYRISRRVKLFNMTFDYDNEYTREGSYLTFYSTGCEAKTITPYITDKPIIYPSTYKREDLLNTYYYTIKKGWVLTSELFRFKGFDDYYIPDFYHKVAFNDLQIYGEDASYVGITYSTAAVLIDEYNGYFSDVGMSLFNGTKRYLELQLIKGDSNYYYLAFKENMYVNPVNLRMSSTSKEGYVQTRHFYLPRGAFPDQSHFKFQFSIKELGMSKVTLGHYLYVAAPIDTIGNCADSEYCVGVSSGNPDFELGDVEEHHG